MKYKKLPVEIEAVEFDGTDESVDWLLPQLISGEIGRATNRLYINTLEGQMTAMKGDYVIKGVNGEFYPCKPDIFKKTYELSSDSKIAIREIELVLKRNREELELVRKDGTKVHKDIYLKGVIRGLEDALLILQSEIY